eukprot:CAMPEP_0194362540 /NCGR_PEP_ID=MMETSP0174-20130528/10301_1 /TAXON_ID=216777 /ORGANISM="Proboscia alata, Strain PI-D3" /LENGTH=476 /DNA_ID=CAMNT_0039135469 /DNA_START=68 /DNA_END=1501 /DNA_ORIENTATION=-
MYIFACCLSNSPDGAFLAMGGGNGIASIVETKTFATVHNISRDSRVTCLAWQQRGRRKKGNDHGGGKYLAVGGDDRTLAVIKTKAMMGGDDDDDESIASSYSSMSMMSSASGWEMNKTFLDIDDDGSTEKFMPNWGVQESKSPTADNGVGGAAAKSLLITAVAFSPGTPSEYIALAGNDCSVLIVSTQDWKLVKEIKFSTVVLRLSWSRNGDKLAFLTDQSDLSIFSSKSWDLFGKPLSLHSKPNAVRWSVDNGSVAVGTSDGRVVFYDPEADWNISGEMDESQSPVNDLDWSSGNDFFAVGRKNGSCTIHDASSIFNGFFIAEAELERDGAVLAVAFGAGDGSFLAVGGMDWKVGIYNGKDGWALCQEISMDGLILTVGWSPDGRYLAMGGADQAKNHGVQVIDAISWEELNIVKNSSEDATERVQSLSWNGDGNSLAITGNSGVGRIVDVNNQAVACTLDRSASNLVTRSSTGT